MRLCLHLLRLRPTPAQLEQWNRFDTAPSKTHQLRGWTAWLKELAGPEIFDDLPREPCHRTKYRRELMAQMYEVAEMEEDYLNDAIGTCNIDCGKPGLGTDNACRWKRQIFV